MAETTTAQKDVFNVAMWRLLLASIHKSYYIGLDMFSVNVFFLKDSRLSIAISMYFRILLPFESVSFEFDLVKSAIEQTRNEIGSLSFCPG